MRGYTFLFKWTAQKTTDLGSDLSACQLCFSFLPLFPFYSTWVYWTPPPPPQFWIAGKTPNRNTVLVLRAEIFWKYTFVFNAYYFLNHVLMLLLEWQFYREVAVTKMVTHFVIIQDISMQI